MNNCKKAAVFPALIVLLISAGILLFKPFRGENSRRPNIVLIIIDTLRADKLGVYGFPGATSPEIDAMAKEGVVFSRVIAQSSWTRPSIGSMLTSRYPRQLGIYDEKWDMLREEAFTLAEALKESGYATIGITANPSINRFFKFDQGFDRYVDSNVIFPWMKKEPGKRRSTRRFRLWRASEVFERALEEVSKRPVNPCYLQINIMDVHGGIRVPRHAADADLRQYSDAGYLQRVRESSRDIGNFIKALKSRPGWENTVVVLTSDHGEGLSDHPAVPKSRTHGFVLYRSQIWVPLIVHHTGSPLFRPAEVRQTVSLLDLMPTILEAVGADAPGDLQGRSLLPLLSSGRPSAPPSRQIFTETQRGTANKSAVYSDDFIYIQNRDNWEGVPPEELQTTEGKENGTATDVAGKFPREVTQLSASLREFEERFPPAERSNSTQSPSQADIERLRTLGYLN